MSFPPSRDLPSTTPAEGTCGVCGHPLPPTAPRCSMCGAPPLRRISASEAFRCLVCSAVISPRDRICPACGMDFTGKAREADLRVRCPVCAADADLSMDRCPSCASPLFVTLEDRGAPPPAGVRCRYCAAPATEDDLTCRTCSRALWDLSDEDWGRSVADALQTAGIEIDLSKEETWIDVSSARHLLVSAREALARREYAVALRTARASGELAKGTRVQARIYQDAYLGAVGRLGGARETGSAVDGCETLLRLAVAAREAGGWKDAVRMAIQSRLCAEEAEARHRGPRPSD